MISLTCPKCSTRLEIDDGFHGGVCRCYDCGALMTVPEDPKKEKAEELIRKRLTRRKAPARPAAPRPEAPDGRPERPGEPAATPTPASASGRPSDPNARPEPPVTEEPAEEPSDTLHFETASGREVDIPVDQIDAVPVARKKQAVRWSTRSGVILVMAGMMCIVFWGMLSLFMPGGETDTGYDPNAGRAPQETDNIFLKDGARFLGQPLDERTVILADASGEMNERLAWVRRAAVAFLGRLPEGHRVQFVWSTPKGPVVYPDEPQPAAAFDMKRWTDQLEAIWTSGDVSLKAGFEQALLANPDRVILVAAPVPTSQQKYLARRMRDTPGVKFSLVLLDAANVDPDAPLAQTALDAGGTYINHPIGKLQQWFKAFDAQHPAPAVDVPAAATGGILREVWLNVSGDQLTRLTQHAEPPRR